ncbi:glycosyltransferase family 71 protein [Gonapodya prolifera JEL478]|uniref:Glycosyltransferase family 71 protein n=1 Tax=Gonapodya prolifera (strain JEL478) TaxID=1344416 RepID=A0A139AQ86_GONPJ|nr:glycosyltransferase family 71 protein [Gonapodya prolifera JEL478]|eukprot:KXS18645.1 glycosyltransferase family 71 protein [Gonapodya prolifera JEL478]
MLLAARRRLAVDNRQHEDPDVSKDKRPRSFPDIKRYAPLLAVIVVFWVLFFGIGRQSEEARPNDSARTLSSGCSGDGALPAAISLADFDFPPLLQASLLAPFSADDAVTLGERSRTFFSLHRKLRVLDQHLSSRVDSTPVSVREQFDRFQDFMGRFERLLFPWLRSPIAKLYSQLQRTPKTRGIVITAGNAQVRLTMVAIQSIRGTGCDLPIEIYHVGPTDLSMANRGRLQSLGNGYDLVVRDLLQDLGGNEFHDGGSWAAKPFAALLSSFSEVLLQDSDVTWVGSPFMAFDDPVYRKTGTLFYYDRRALEPIVKTPTRETALKLLPAHYRDGTLPTYLIQNAIVGNTSQHNMESGVVLIDKSRLEHLYGLLGVCKLNSRRERDFFYRFFWGDKETFWLGWEMAGSGGLYGFSQWPAGQLGILVRGDQDQTEAVSSGVYQTVITEPPADPRILRLCSLQLAHVDGTGKRLLWYNGGVVRNKFRADSTPMSPTHWALEAINSRWTIDKENIACLHMSPQSGLTVGDEGNPVESEIFDLSGLEDEGDALPVAIEWDEKVVFDSVEEWWRESGRRLKMAKLREKVSKHRHNGDEAFPEELSQFRAKDSKRLAIPKDAVIVNHIP